MVAGRNGEILYLCDKCQKSTTKAPLIQLVYFEFPNALRTDDYWELCEEHKAWLEEQGRQKYCSLKKT